MLQKIDLKCADAVNHVDFYIVLKVFIIKAVKPEKTLFFSFPQNKKIIVTALFLFCQHCVVARAKRKKWADIFQL